MLHKGSERLFKNLLNFLSSLQWAPSGSSYGNGPKPCVTRWEESWRAKFIFQHPRRGGRERGSEAGKVRPSQQLQEETGSIAGQNQCLRRMEAPKTRDKPEENTPKWTGQAERTLPVLSNSPARSLTDSRQRTVHPTASKTGQISLFSSVFKANAFAAACRYRNKGWDLKLRISAAGKNDYRQILRPHLQVCPLWATAGTASTEGDRVVFNHVSAGSTAGFLSA